MFKDHCMRVEEVNRILLETFLWCLNTVIIMTRQTGHFNVLGILKISVHIMYFGENKVITFH